MVVEKEEEPIHLEYPLSRYEQIVFGLLKAVLRAEILNSLALHYNPKPSYREYPEDQKRWRDSIYHFTYVEGL